MQLKRLILILPVLLFMVQYPAQAQERNFDKLTLSEYFNFWIGRWDLSWTNSEGHTEHGRNNVTKILNGKVIQENFSALDGKFKDYNGKSWSVYNSQTKKWTQTWVDNEGAYLEFTGKVKDNKRMFIREGKSRQGKQVLQRMVFYNITESSFTWDWQQSEDNGGQWKLLWRIEYERQP